MPLFTYTCDKCGSIQEHLAALKNRDGPGMVCPGACGGRLKRQGVEQFVEGKPSFQGGAVLSNGKKIAGHFGKDARRKGGWHRP